MGLSVSELGRSFPLRHGENLDILKSISFELEAGQSLAVLGASGSGKSTLLHILGTLDRPDAGTVLLGGKDPFRLSPSQLAEFRNEHVGFVFQDHHLLSHLSAVQNVLVPALAKGATTREQQARAEELMEIVGLSERLDHYPAELSGGERQRIAVARALLMQPELVLADEPTGNLDSQNSQAIVDLLMEVKSLDAADPILVMVTHSLEVAKQLERQVTLRDGQFIENR